MTTLTPINAIQPIIPALPDTLRVVPSWQDGEPGDESWRDRFPVWSDNLKDFRVWVLKKAAADATFRQIQMQAAANDPAYFLSVFGWIFEPRDTDLGDPGWYPWALFPHQVIAIRQLQEAMRTKKPYSDIVWEKSRDMGATWTAMGYCLHQWLFARSFTAGLVSFREDAVDDGTPSSMFFKLRGLFGIMDYGEAPGIPRWMRPDGYVKEIHGRRLKFNHPSKLCVIRGESTTARAGTGDRNTMRVNDEGAKHEQLENNLESQRAVTNHILTLSSAYRGYGRDFEKYAERSRNVEHALELAHGIPNPAEGGPRYYRMEYWMHPFHDESWREAEQAAYTSPEAFAREVLIDYATDNDLLVYGNEAAKVPIVEDGDIAGNPLYIGIDPGLSDDTAIVFATSWGDPFHPTVRWLDCYENRGKPTSYYAHLLTGIPPEPGDDCFGMYTFNEREQTLMAWMLDNWLSGRRIRVVMDPAGAQAHMGATVASKKTQQHPFPEQLNKLTRDLRRRYVETQLAGLSDESVKQRSEELPIVQSIQVRWEHLYSTNRYDPRHSNMRTILARSEVAATPGGYRLLECWKEYRYQQRQSGAQATTAPKPVHDEYSHAVTAAEHLSSDLLGPGLRSGLAVTNRRSTQTARKPRLERRKAA